MFSRSGGVLGGKLKVIVGWTKDGRLFDIQHVRRPELEIACLREEVQCNMYLLSRSLARDVTRLQLG
jgi:hypothetical protein